MTFPVIFALLHVKTVVLSTRCTGTVKMLCSESVPSFSANIYVLVFKNKFTAEAIYKKMNNFLIIC